MPATIFFVLYSGFRLSVLCVCVILFPVNGRRINLRYPEFLKEGGRVGFIAPSFGCTTEPYRTLFENAVKYFKAGGYETVTGPNCFKSDGCGKSSTPENCAAEINDFFLNDRCDVIISCGGGETMCEDLDLTDLEAMKKAVPKWYMGYSDNTNLIFPLTTVCDTAAVYGPNASAFGTDPVHPSVADAFNVLTGKSLSVSNYDKWEKEEPGEDAPLTAPYNCTEPFDLKVFDFSKNREIPEPGKDSVRFSGRLVGGCLDCLVLHCGTKFDNTVSFAEKYKEDGIIWFIESCDLNPMGIRRALWQLSNAGWFRYVKGFIIGRAYHYDDAFMGMDRINAVTGILSKYGVPVLLDADLGHLPPMMPIVSGALCDVESIGGSLRLNYRFE